MNYVIAIHSFDRNVKPLFAIIETGLVDPAFGNASHIALARGYGATILEKCQVNRITPDDDGVLVETEQGASTVAS